MKIGIESQFPLGIPNETDENLYDISKFKKNLTKGFVWFC